MNTEQLNQLRALVRPIPKVNTFMLTNKTPRTLYLGLDNSGATLHVYLGRDGLLHTLWFRSSSAGERVCISEHRAVELAARDCVTDKSMVPASCDHEFCTSLWRAGVDFQLLEAVHMDSLKQSAFQAPVFEDFAAGVA